jgi:hypothetical protein
MEAKRQARQVLREGRAGLREMAQRAGLDDVAGEIIRERAAVAARLHLLPAPTQAHTSDDLEAASEAAAERERVAAEQSRHDEETAERERVAEAALMAEMQQPRRLFLSDQDYYEHLLSQRAERDLTDGEADFVRRHEEFLFGEVDLMGSTHSIARTPLRRVAL